MNRPIELSIIVPCYNEEKNIPALLERFARVMRPESPVELVLVDNGSSDQTGRVIDDEIVRNHYDFARKTTVAQNCGYGFGIMSGLREASGDLLAWTHADQQTDPADVLEAYRRYRAEKDERLLVKGARKARPWGDKIMSVGMQCLASLALGTCVTEINAQPKLFPRALYEKMQAPPDDFSLDLYVLELAKHNHYRIVSIPVYFGSRLHGEAKGGGSRSLRQRWNLILRTVIYIFKLRNHMQRSV
ncbi:MAG: glycosyltransferase family 2 protein [Candidatus Omnitrophica bacterium]|nr:glycosyltransferase family 2 protein [Candidatus Omnitrophota bacterium]